MEYYIVYLTIKIFVYGREYIISDECLKRYSISSGYGISEEKVNFYSHSIVPGGLLVTS